MFSNDYGQIKVHYNIIMLWFLGWSGTENTFLFQELTWPSSSTYPRMMAIIINTRTGMEINLTDKGAAPRGLLVPLVLIDH